MNYIIYGIYKIWNRNLAKSKKIKYIIYSLFIY